MELARNLNDRDAHCWQTANVGKAANSDPVPCVHLCTFSCIFVHLCSLYIFVQYWFLYKAGAENLQSKSWWLPTACISLAQPLQPSPPPLCTAIYPPTRLAPWKCTQMHKAHSLLLRGTSGQVTLCADVWALEQANSSLVGHDLRSHPRVKTTSWEPCLFRISWNNLKEMIEMLAASYNMNSYNE